MTKGTWRIPKENLFAELKDSALMWFTMNGKMAFSARKPSPIEDEAGEDILIYLPMARGTSFLELNLTALNEGEFRALKKLLGEALRKAEPIIKLRDADAQRKIQKGEVAPARAYRSVPNLFSPEGKIE